jgi:hypothetical protein
MEQDRVQAQERGGEMKKKGEISIISKFGGVRLKGSEEWLNPIPDIKEGIMTDLKAGMMAELTLDENNKITDYDFEETKTEPAKKVQDYYEDRSQSIIRQSCLKCACEVIKLPAGITVSEGSKQITDLAERFETWVLR